jgi:hypothetical protein
MDKMEQMKFPDFSGPGSLFRKCNQCEKCKLMEEKDSWGIYNLEKVASCMDYKVICDFGAPHKKYQWNDDEYFLICSHFNVKGECYYIFTNYGEMFTIRPDVREISYPCNKMGLLSEQHGQDGRRSPIYSEYMDLKIPLTTEYINILNSMSHVSGSGHGLNVNYYKSNKLIHNYKKYNLGNCDIHNLEKKQYEINRSIIELQKIETSNVTHEDNLKLLQKTVETEKDKLQEEKTIHKEKLKHLFERETAVKMKETLFGCKEELKDIALQLNDIYILTDSPDRIIHDNINNIINKLNILYSEPIIATTV